MSNVATLAANLCDRCANPSAIFAYWGEMLCQDCTQVAALVHDQDRTWPVFPSDPDPRWTPAVLDHKALRQAWGATPTGSGPITVEHVARIARRSGATQVWIHGAGVERVEGLEPDRAWQQRDGIEFVVPAWEPGASPWSRAASSWELLAQLAAFAAEVGVPWRRSGAVTSDLLLYRLGALSGRRWQRTEQPPVGLRQRGRPPLGDEPQLSWTRPPTEPESKARYLHALDLNGMFLAAASSVSCPAGTPEHILEPRFDRTVPGYWLIDPGEAWSPLLPHQAGKTRRDGGTVWVTTPTAALLDKFSAAGIVPLEAWTWSHRNPGLTSWYKTLRDARSRLQGTLAGEAVKYTYTAGIGRLGSPTRAKGDADPLYQPYVRHAVNAEARCRLWARMVGLLPDRTPVALDTDCGWWLTSSSTPERLALALGLPLGPGLGHFKSAGSTTGAPGRAALADGLLAVKAATS